MIPITRPDIRPADAELVSKVLLSGQLVQGAYAKEFEKKLSDYMGVKYALAVSSGTAALHIALLACGIGPGDIVLVPAFSFIATANAVRLVGATPQFIDISTRDYNIDVDALSEALSVHKSLDRVKAVIPVHEFGCPANLTRIRQLADEYQLKIIEDAACALGAQHSGQHVGMRGDVACFSFHPRKSLTTGEGGLVVTDKEAIAEQANLLRSHGMVRLESGDIDCLRAGFNYRMTDFQAALGSHQLDRFDANMRAREDLVSGYFAQLAGIDAYSLPERTVGHAWQSLMILMNSGSTHELIRYAEKKGVQLGTGAQCIPETQAYMTNAAFPNASLCRKQGFVVPLYYGLDTSSINQVCRVLQSYAEKKL